jgi:hypothetical protein
MEIIKQLFQPWHKISECPLERIHHLVFTCEYMNELRETEYSKEKTIDPYLYTRVKSNSTSLCNYI